MLCCEGICLGCIWSYFTFLKLCVFLYNMLESFMHQLLFTERWFAYYLFHISIFGFMRGVCSALKLQFQKASNTSQENWNRKLKYYRVPGYDSRLHGRNTPEYLRAQNVIFESIVTVMQLEALLLNWESPLGMLNGRALFSSLSVKYQPLPFWLNLLKVCSVLFGW